MKLSGKKGRKTFSTAVTYDATTCDIEPKIRLNRVVMNDLFVKIGAFVSVHRPPDVTYREPLRLLSIDDNDDLKVSRWLGDIYGVCKVQTTTWPT
ncbi:hypothetical protein PanWU01x14_185780 [Parasponia andersonii]|uniref:Uncharacterized protein n=1 Tax=Parasponia andersonii TaxID=3476 RepID=A0A2P5C430_PARAD|nr:hypothetical protein PanWU01x14_185780 [Parasponia andersonii]